jgi:O-antigen/teichoic acid export membrane protein
LNKGQSTAESGGLDRRLTEGRLIARNVLINILGYGAPLLAAVIAIPILVRGLGTARFGVLSLIWVFFGYLGLLDLGLGRALTQMVAREVGMGARENIPPIVCTGSTLLALLGLVLAAASWFFLPFLVYSVLGLSSDMGDEALEALRILVLSLPFLLVGVGLRGVLEAFQKFGATNAVRIPMGVFTFLGPVLILPLSSTLTAIALVLAFGRVASCAAYCAICPSVIPGLIKRPAIQPSLTRYLFSFGGWVTVTNVINPLLFYIERFVIASLLSATAVAYYATPNEVITKLLLLSSAAIGVLYPAFASSFSFDRDRTETLFLLGIKYIGITLFPIVALFLLYAEDALSIWMGPEFASHSAKVLKWLSPGVLLLSLGHIPYALIQGTGRPDLAAKIHLMELPIYSVALYWCTLNYGIVGAAAAWSARGIVETLLFYVISLRILRSRGIPIVNLGWIIFLSLSTLLLFASLKGGYLKAITAILFLFAYLAVAWKRWLKPDERSFILGLFRKADTQG